MTNKDLIKRISKKHNIPQTTLIKYFDILELALKEEVKDLKDGEKLKVMDFTFEAKTVNEREMRNPKTGEKVWVKPMKKLRITQSSDWKRILRDN